MDGVSVFEEAPVESSGRTLFCGAAGQANVCFSFWMIWAWGMPSRSISLSWSRISFGSRATLPQRPRNGNGLMDLVGSDGLLDWWIIGLVGSPGRMSEVVADLWFLVCIVFVCVFGFWCCEPTGISALLVFGEVVVRQRLWSDEYRSLLSEKLENYEVIILL